MEKIILDLNALPPKHQGNFSLPAAACAEIAARLELLALQDLTADYQIQRLKGELWRVQGHFTANVVQECVRTLTPIPSTISESFSCRAGEAADIRAWQSKNPSLAETEDAPEETNNGQLDILELVVQYLGLSLDPYPSLPNTIPPD